MADLKETRQKVTIAIAAIVVLDLVLLGIYFSPLVGAAPERRAELSQLEQDLRRKTKEVEPLRGLDQKIKQAQGQIDQFYKDRLPSQDSTISTDLGKLAQQTGVRVGGVKYKWKDPETTGVRAVEIDADFTGDYLQLVRFINALEREQLFFVVDSVELGGEQQGQVKLQMKLETYLKVGT